MQWVPLLSQYDIDKDPRYNQYPYQEADKYDEEEEDMEVDDWAPGNAGAGCMAAPAGIRCQYCPLKQLIQPLLNNLRTHPIVSIWTQI